MDDLPLSNAGRARTFLFYGGMVAVAAVVFLVIRSTGEGLAAPGGNGVPLPPAAGQSIDTLFHALLALAVIVVTARVVGELFGLIGQPAVRSCIHCGMIRPRKRRS